MDHLHKILKKIQRHIIEAYINIYRLLLYLKVLVQIVKVVKVKIIYHLQRHVFDFKKNKTQISTSSSKSGITFREKESCGRTQADLKKG